MDKNSLSKKIIEEYNARYRDYETFTSKLEKLITTLLEEKNIRIHSITSRAKSKESLQQKVNTSIENYKNLDDIPDLVGIRIITYFDDEVDKIAQLIAEEFNIDSSRSSDKKDLLDPEDFGYLSLHYIGKLSANRLALSEYRRFANYGFEIQMRSILQHAWDEIEHDLGYKNKNEVPKEIRRRFSRLAGLLELADDEFMSIRNSLLEYKKVVKEQIETVPKTVLIDSVSLASFIENNILTIELDNKLAKIFKAKEIHPVTNKFSSDLIDKLKSVGISNIEDLNLALTRYGNLIEPFASKWISVPSYNISKGITLFYLCYVMLGTSGSITRVFNFLNDNNLGLIEVRNSTAKKIISICDELLKNRTPIS